MMIVPNAYAQEAEEENFVITEYKSFNSPDGNLVVVGSALNKGNIPAQI
jgi:hypothetical protein